jgi:CHAT domain-containing protein
MRDTAAELAASDVFLTRVLALGVLATAYCAGQACARGAEIAFAGHALGEELLRQGAPLQAATLSGLATNAVAALRQLGRNGEALAAVDRLLPLHERLDPEDPNVHSLRMARVGLLLDLNQVEEAERAFARWSGAVHGAAAVEVPLLAHRIATALKDARELGEARPTLSSPEDQHARFLRAKRLGDALEQRLAPGQERNELHATARIRGASAILLDPVAGRDPARLRDSVAELRDVRRFTAQASPRLDRDALWPLSICCDRLGELAESVRALERLRAYVEEERAGIADPLMRAGAGASYPHLYPNLCRNLTRLGEAEALLEAIESAKGRAIADVLAAKSGRPVDDRDFAAPAKALPALLSAARAHYLSFFVDEDETYAVLAAKDGTFHTAPAIPLGAAVLRTAAAAADPDTWRKDQEVPRALEPLLAWLEPLVARGVLATGDQVAWSPDAALHEIPLHYVRFRGAPAVETFGISRVHGARLLALLLKRPAARPKHHVAIEVPFEEDLSDRRMLEDLHRCPTWLQASGVPGATLEREAADLDALARSDLTRALVHFATHGTFPGASETGPLANPFRGSGLAIAEGERLPSRARLSRGDGRECILTPERILERGLALRDSHVTLQACVSGLAREGVGGDALGLEWALVQSGAASVLSSHWDVEPRASADFVECFYDAWLVKGRTRGEAWREVVLALRRGVGPLSRARGWAAFSLSGDWR